jgi:ribosome recycling factor
MEWNFKKGIKKMNTKQMLKMRFPNKTEEEIEKMAQKIEKDKENIKNNLNNSDFIENLAKKRKEFMESDDFKKLQKELKGGEE